ncbi:uncharacterized protein BKA55DRAFT_704659 [Fusarium redolens]|uniref:Short-chain dehydrogenase n=1 Tax=Fusarium redolens TaxID=48865 RepID=A0A9P9K989_FUSRE|nr:uncharacterized protein BKA55DRAFT_704659 [Fusarium redolens]KAH7244589.1 hypothetical protein BKA55DRAFT_704659 [Fusarium redolens]
MARIFITGSADGFGLESARQLVQRGHTVYLHARNDGRAAHAKASCPGAAGIFVADLTSVEETKRLASEVNAIRGFDAIIHNAGIMPAIVAINILAPYVLTALNNRPKRLIFIASILHTRANTSIKDIFWYKRGEAQFQDFYAYCDSKLHTILLANAVARRFKDVGADALNKLEDGVDIYVKLAEGNYDQSLTGVYFEPKRRLGEPLPESGDVNLQEKIVEACEKVVGLKLPG